MVSLFLVRRGFRVGYLGPSLTAVGLGEALRRQRPDLLRLSATSEESADRATVERLLTEPASPVGRDEQRQPAVAG